MQHTGFTHERLGDVMGLRDAGQFRIEYAGEGEHVVALIPQRDAHRANASGILGFAALQFRDDEVEQCLPRGQVRPRQRQNVMAQPLGERSNVASQPTRLGFGLPRKLQLEDKIVVWTKLAGAVDLVLQLLAP
jgi:hypothetical protein